MWRLHSPSGGSGGGGACGDSCSGGVGAGGSDVVVGQRTRWTAA